MKTVVITGGSDGLGKEIATQLAHHYKVVILSRNEQALSEVATALNCDYKVCDVRDYAQVETTMREIGEIDYLINNAGLWLQGPLDETDPQRISETLDVNTLGTILCTKAVIPGMKQRQSGLIINVVSQAGLNARAGWPVYIASKWAITGFTKSMQQELEPFGVRVVGMYPGTMKTELFAKSGVPKDLSGALDTADVAKIVEFMVGLPDTVTIPEIGIKPF